jgi:hypothetical protein
VFDAAQTRLRLLISALEKSEPAVEDDLESLDFTTTPAVPEVADDTKAGTPSEEGPAR